MRFGLTNDLLYTPGDWKLNSMSLHRRHPPPRPSSDGSFAQEGDATTTPLPSDSILIFLLLWQPGCRGFTVTFPSFLRTCFAASLNICTVGNPFLSSMGRSQSRVIVEVVAPVALLPGIALSPWFTVRYGRHRRTVVISLRSSFPRTSIWSGAPIPSLTWSSSRGSVTAKTPQPARSLWRPTTIHLASC